VVCSFCDFLKGIFSKRNILRFKYRCFLIFFFYSDVFRCLLLPLLYISRCSVRRWFLFSVSILFFLERPQDFEQWRPEVSQQGELEIVAYGSQLTSDYEGEVFLFKRTLPLFFVDTHFYAFGSR